MSQLVLYAMTQKGHAVVEALAQMHPGILHAVVGARDPKLREDYYQQIVDLCQNAGIPFYDRSDAPNFDQHTALAVSWRWMIRGNGTRLIVFHDSLLPRYRGFNPLVSALINGDHQVGVSALFASEQYDRGPLIDQCVIDIRYPITIQAAIDAILPCYTQLAIAIAEKVAQDQEIPTTQQDEAAASYSLWRDDEDYRIDWSLDADTIVRTIDALGSPYAGASTLVGDVRATLLRATTCPDARIENRTPGKVIDLLDGRPIVVCGSGLVLIEELIHAETGDNLLPLRLFRTRFR